jgi:hypothetical protein
MSILLFIVGVIAFAGGAVLAGFGIPISEFSFGNTLITSGATVGIGGLLLIGLGAVVSQLKRIAEGLAAPMPERAARPAETFEPMAAPSPAPAPIPAPAPVAARAAPAAAPEGGRFPFPTRRKREPGAKEPKAAEPDLPHTAAPVAEERGSFAPSLRNPDVPPVAVDDEVSLSPHEPLAPAPRDLDEAARSDSTEENVGVSAMRRGPIRESGWRPGTPPAPPAQSRRPTYFDTMWPAEGRPSRGPAAAEPNADAVPEVKPEFALEPELPPEPALELPPHETAAEPPAPSEASEGEPRPTVEVLKSGVVDGMGYTLYVDGSIEAELPQGTLRFASINELRAHLEKNS